MTIGPGSRLGPYEVTALIGEGGMGKVWRAHHTGLKRDDALKVLPDAFASDPERLARFQREAQVLASLNHPNIAHVHGLERSDGVQALVMELVEGPTLADRIAQGPIPVDEALPIAKQMAEALEAAHEQGIIHRDLKPANVKVRPDGTVKVLDFGLAKLAETGTGATANVGLSNSPTITSPALMTGAGVLLGTVSYMSPEQARGKPVDKRCDIWAFGCVLYEMLTGSRAFDGEDVTSVLASVIKGEPNWAALSAEAPAPIVTLARRCLQKEPRSRIANIAVASFVIEETARLDPALTPGRIAQLRPPLSRRVMRVAALVLVGALLSGGVAWMLTRAAPSAVIRTVIATSGSTALAINGADRDIAITPDGSRIVYRGTDGLLVRALDQLEPVTLASGGMPRGLFTSPDSHWVGFTDGVTGELKKIAITGGPAATIAAFEGTARGASWGADGTIVYATSDPTTGLLRVSAAGGERTVLTTPDRARQEGDHFWPEIVGDGRGVLFTIMPAGDRIEDAQLAVLDLRTNTSRVLIRDGGSHAHYQPTGHLVYGAAGTMRAVRFDADRLEVTGTPVPIAEGVHTNPQGLLNAAVARNGTLLYVPANVDRSETVVSVDQEGRPSALPGMVPGNYRDLAVSPDGRRVAVAMQGDIWIYDFERTTLTRLTTNPSGDRRPLWTPDGRRVLFTTVRAGYPEIFWRPADGTGTDERLFTSGTDRAELYATGWSPDGARVLFTDALAVASCTIGQFAVTRPSDVSPLVKSESCNGNGTISRDGRWIAYSSNVSGRSEIYIERYPELGDRQQVSTDGGRMPVWSRDGRELFFRSLDDQVLAVSVETGATSRLGRARMLFKSQSPAVLGSQPFDVTPEGRFVIISPQAPENASSNLVLVVNWFEELKRLVPTN